MSWDWFLIHTCTVLIHLLGCHHKLISNNKNNISHYFSPLWIAAVGSVHYYNYIFPPACSVRPQWLISVQVKEGDLKSHHNWIHNIVNSHSMCSWDLCRTHGGTVLISCHIGRVRQCSVSLSNFVVHTDQKGTPVHV